MVIMSIEKCDISNRKDLLNNVILCGGSSLFENFDSRFENGLIQALNYTYENKVKLASSEEPSRRHHQNWLGGSVMTSIGSFDQFLMNKKEYEEHGPVLIERKTVG